MVGIFMESAACKTSAVNGVINRVQVLLCWSPSVCILRYLDLASRRKRIESLAMDPPVNIIESLGCPCLWDVWVMASGSCDNVTFVAVCRRGNTGVLLNLFGDWAAFVEESSLSARDMCWKHRTLQHRSVVGLVACFVA